jgi:hypothetical protein
MSATCAFAADTQAGFCHYYPSWRYLTDAHTNVLHDIAARISDADEVPYNTTYPAIEYMLSHLPRDKTTGPYAILVLGLCYPIALMVGVYIKNILLMNLTLVPFLAFSIVGPIYLHIKAHNWYVFFEAAATLPAAAGLVDSVRSVSSPTMGLAYSSLAFNVAAIAGICLLSSCFYLGRKKAGTNASTYAPVHNPTPGAFAYGNDRQNAPTNTAYPMENLPVYSRKDPLVPDHVVTSSSAPEAPPLPPSYARVPPIEEEEDEEAKSGEWRTFVGRRLG